MKQLRLVLPLNVTGASPAEQGYGDGAGATRKSGKTCIYVL